MEFLKGLLILLMIGAGYQDFKSFKIKNYLIVLGIIIGIILLGYNLYNDWYTYMDKVMIIFVALLILVSIKIKQMGMADVLVIPMVIVFPFTTVLAIAITSFMGFLLAIMILMKNGLQPNNKIDVMKFKMPFIAMFIFNFLLITIFVPTYFEKANICDMVEKDYDSYIENIYKYENCSKIVTIYTNVVYNKTFDKYPFEMNISNPS